MPTQIADIYEPLTFAETIDEKAIELNAFYASGIIVADARVSAQASAGGRIGEMPNFKPLATTEANISSDDPASFSTPEKVESQTQVWRLAALNQSWSNMDLAQELALKDPAAAITGGIGQYWATQQERRVIASAQGVLADNVADDSSDMLEDIYSDVVVGSLDAGNYISPEAVMDCQQTAGDHMTIFTAIAMHSVVYTNLKKQQVIDFIPPADSAVPVPYYLGMRVVVDDSLPVITGTNTPAYISILFGPGCIAHGAGNVENPSEYERIPSAGDGGGQEVIYSRTSDIYHPWGCSFISGSVAAESATIAELKDADNWNRIYARKNVAMAFLQSNG